MNVAQETLGFRRGSLSLPLSLLMSAFALLIPPASFTGHLRRPTERSPTTSALLLEHAHGCRSSHSVARTTNLQLRRGRPDFCQGITLPNCLAVCRFAMLKRCLSSEATLHIAKLNALKGTLKSAASVHGLAPLHLPRRTT